MLHKWKFTEKFALAFTFNTLLNFFLKYLLLIPRPLASINSPSMPSLHAQTVFFVAMFFSKKFPVASILFFILAIIIGISRVELGFHRVEEVIVGAAIGIIIGHLAYIKKMKSFSPGEMVRQTIHFIGIAVIPLSMFFPPQQFWAFVQILIVLALIVMGTEKYGTLKKLQRKNEDIYLRAVLFVSSMALTWIIFPFHIASAAIIALCIGDSMSTIYGKHFGKTPIPYSKNKTIEGSIAMFMSTYVILFFLLGREIALLIALLATVVESLPRIDDNVSIPLVVALALTFMGV